VVGERLGQVGAVATDPAAVLDRHDQAVLAGQREQAGCGRAQPAGVGDGDADTAGLQQIGRLQRGAGERADRDEQHVGGGSDM
jgi:hypothetical protein